MFTGIIEEVGLVVRIDDSQDFRSVLIHARQTLADLQAGSSIAVCGVCLTVRTVVADGFTAELSHETLDRTTLDTLRAGTLVNLERSMRADARFGGHIVQGHVDGKGRIREFSREGDVWSLDVEFPAGGRRYIVEKGSIAVDGISLTVARFLDDNAFSIAIIPHTFENTNLRKAIAGDPVNLEYDVIAKYVENLVKPYAIRND